MFSIVPLSSLLLLILLAVLPPLIWPLPPGIHFPSYRNFPFPLPELLTSISLWTLSHTLRVPIYSLSFFLAPISSSVAVSDLLTTTIHVLLTNFLRLSSFALLQVRHEMDYPLPTCLDNSFRRVIWIAIGWSIAEVGVSVVQGYETLGLYKGVMVPPGRENEFLRGWKDENADFRPEIAASNSPGTMERSGYCEDPEETHRHMTFIPDSAATGGLHTTELDAELAAGSQRRYLYRTASAAAICLQLEQDLDQLLTLKAREEVEEVYGVPAIVCSYLLLPDRPNLIFKIWSPATANSCLHINAPTPELDNPFARAQSPSLICVSQFSNISSALTDLAHAHLLVKPPVRDNISDRHRDSSSTFDFTHPARATEDRLTYSFIYRINSWAWFFVCWVGCLEGSVRLGLGHWGIIHSCFYATYICYMLYYLAVIFVHSW